LKTLRLGLSVFVLVALATGYFASQYFSIDHRSPEWTLLIDTPAVVWLSLAILLGAIALSLFRRGNG
jgi:hypothetical protein